MSISVFELFSIGVGPSSSHTVGPMRAARDFLMRLPSLSSVKTIKINLYGSLALTGRGHGTDKAILMGLQGYEPETAPLEVMANCVQTIFEQQQLSLLNQHLIPFNLSQDLIFKLTEKLDYHSNGMLFQAFNDNGALIEEAVYFSIGGGFIVREGEVTTGAKAQTISYPFQSAADLLAHCEKNKCTIANIMLANEQTWRTKEEIKAGILAIARVMEDCIDRGCQIKGTLPGGLQVRRRAPGLYEKLKRQDKPGPQHPLTMSWLDLFAMAVNEENAAGGRVVTAPTNGAAGIIPAVLNYYKYFCKDISEEGIIEFLLTAGAIGILYKQNASISGAEMGCQGEVGVACSMAAAGLAAALHGTVAQVENAAEIGMEHNLGLTCDPVGGLVQIPCIERNAMGAVKAVNAANLALAEDGNHKVSLDMVINTMREIGRNMNSMYKETSQGGLAVNVPEC